MKRFAGLIMYIDLVRFFLYHSINPCLLADQCYYTYNSIDILEAKRDNDRCQLNNRQRKNKQLREFFQAKTTVTVIGENVTELSTKQKKRTKKRSHLIPLQCPLLAPLQLCTFFSKTPELEPCEFTLVHLPFMLITQVATRGLGL